MNYVLPANLRRHVPAIVRAEQRAQQKLDQAQTNRMLVGVAIAVLAMAIAIF